MSKQVRDGLGQRDPDKTLSPEEQMADQQAQQQQQQLQDAQFRAQLAKLQSEAEGADAKALLTRVTAFYEALQAGQVAATVPHVAPIADQILAGAGFKDQGGQDPNLQQPAITASTPALTTLQPRSEEQTSDIQSLMRIT